MNFLTKEFDIFTKKTWLLIFSIFHKSKSLNDFLVRAVNDSVFFVFFRPFTRVLHLEGSKIEFSHKRNRHFYKLHSAAEFFDFLLSQLTA